MRITIDHIVAHSNQVTAAVCLHQGAASTIDEIAFHLQWQPGSVPTYFCETFQGVGDILQKAIVGIFKAN
jgi:hypothetical protein